MTSFELSLCGRSLYFWRLTVVLQIRIIDFDYIYLYILSYKLNPDIDTYSGWVSPLLNHFVIVFVLWFLHIPHESKRYYHLVNQISFSIGLNLWLASICVFLFNFAHYFTKFSSLIWFLTNFFFCWYNYCLWYF